MGHREDAIQFIKRSDLVVMPNRIVNDKVPCEAWGIVCAEGLMNDVPVVATDAVGSAVDLIKDGTNGYLIDWKSDDALYNAMLRSIKRIGAKQYG
jgi:glycosyltransferase involved in cell wall biosynthesis